MDITTITFGIKDVVAIIGGVLALSGFIYAMKRQSDKTDSRLTTLEINHEADIKNTEERFLHARNAKKANIMKIYEDMNKVEENLKEEITEIKSEQKTAHDKMSTKLDTLSNQMSTMNINLAELTGYIKAKKENDK